MCFFRRVVQDIFLRQAKDFFGTHGILIQKCQGQTIQNKMAAIN